MLVSLALPAIQAGSVSSLVLLLLHLCERALALSTQLQTPSIHALEQCMRAVPDTSLAFAAFSGCGREVATTDIQVPDFRPFSLGQ